MFSLYRRNYWDRNDSRLFDASQRELIVKESGKGFWKAKQGNRCKRCKIKTTKKKANRRKKKEEKRLKKKNT